jgi:hypothetical protein
VVKKIVAAIGSNKKSKRFFALCRKNEGKALEISRRQKNKNRCVRCEKISNGYQIVMFISHHKI